MSRKKHKDIKPTEKKKEEIKDISPFSSIVLKEKKEEPKKTPPKAMPKTSGKKPHEIVQGYNPQASFADILYAFEHTGNPYAMPESKKKNISEKKTDFGAILDQWEGKTLVKKKAGSNSAQEKKFEYKPTKSFADILSQFEGTDKPSTGRVNNKAKPDFEAPEEVTFFRKEDEDYKRDPNSAWSILGSNDSYVRPVKKKEEKKAPEKEAKKDYKRNSTPYKATKDFAEILSSFEDRKKKKEETVKPQRIEKKPEPIQEPVEILSENNLFKKEDSDNKRAKNASWSVLGNNESFVRPVVEPKKEDIVVEKTEEKEELKRVSSPYVPTKDFSAILSSFEEKKVEKVAAAPILKEEEIFDEPISGNNLFKREDEDNKRAKNAAWSVLGNNESFVRPVVGEKKPIVEEAPKVKRVSEPYEPKKDFSEVLKNYEEKRPIWSFNGNSVEYDKSKVSENSDNPKPVEAEPVKTFEEILKEKGDDKKFKPQYSIAELRRMLPQSTLDLHGETIAEAEAQIRDFLDDCLKAGLRKVSIITGKGLHSEGGVGVLRDFAERVLEESGMVSEKNNAPLRAGGSGALWIILKA